MGQQFAVKTAIAIFGLSLCLGTIDFPNITDDNLLVAVFGGFFLGAGIGFAVRGGAVIDGTEVLAIQLSRKLSTTIGDIIIIINVIIFLTAAYFLGVEKALYSMITYLSASKTLDFLVEGIVSVELKAITKLEDVHFAQAINYLEAYNLEIGLLINFGETSLNFKRFTNKKFKTPETKS